MIALYLPKTETNQLFLSIDWGQGVVGGGGLGIQVAIYQLFQLQCSYKFNTYMYCKSCLI